MHRKVLKYSNIPDLPSPCTGVCTMDMQNVYCKGCFRNRLEIGGWAHMSNEEKLAVIKELKIRRKSAKN